MQRLLIKISGESLSSHAVGIDAAGLQHVTNLILPLYQQGYSLGLVFGGGNFIRGAELASIDRVIADQMGMYATVINALAVSAELGKYEVDHCVITPSKLPNTLEWDYLEALSRMENGEVLLFAGGTGNPFFSTDSAAALRGIQIKANLLIKATKFDGIYDRDPAQFSDAQKLSKLNFDEVLKRQLQVMDLTAFDLCKRYNLPICVCNMNCVETFLQAAAGEAVGSLVSNDV